MRALHYSVVIKQELLKFGNALNFPNGFVPYLTLGHESWVMTERVRS